MSIHLVQTNQRDPLIECRASRTPQKSQIPADHFRFLISFIFIHHLRRFDRISMPFIVILVTSNVACSFECPFSIALNAPIQQGFCLVHVTPCHEVLHILIYNPHSELSCSGMSPLMHRTTTRSKALVVLGSAAAALSSCPVGTGGIWTAGLGLVWALISSPPFSWMTCDFVASCLDYP